MRDPPEQTTKNEGEVAEAVVVSLRTAKPVHVNVSSTLVASSVEEAVVELNKLETAVTLGLAVLAKSSVYGDNAALAAVQKIFSLVGNC